MKQENQTKVISLAKGFRFQWEPAQESYVLLYPEGLVKLNQSAALILSKVDNQRTLGEIIAELSTQFPDVEIEQDITSFVETAIENRWIELND